MTVFRIGAAADLLGVSPDTVRRLVDAGRLIAIRDEHGHRAIDRVDLAAFVRSPAGDVHSRYLQVGSVAIAVIKSTTVVERAGPAVAYRGRTNS